MADARVSITISPRLDLAPMVAQLRAAADLLEEWQRQQETGIDSPGAEQGRDDVTEKVQVRDLID